MEDGAKWVLQLIDEAITEALAHPGSGRSIMLDPFNATSRLDKMSHSERTDEFTGSVLISDSKGELNPEVCRPT